MGSSISRTFNSTTRSALKNFFSLPAHSKVRFSPVGLPRVSIKLHSRDRSTSRTRLSTVRPISMAQISAKPFLRDDKRIFLAQSSFLRLVSMTLLLPGMSTSTARYSRMRPDSGPRRSWKRPNSWTRLSPDRPTSMVRPSLGSNLLATASFDKDVNFDNAIFTGDADFRNAIFAAQCTFVNGKMKFDTWFEHATFKTKPPSFFGCDLHEATVWPSRDENAWPNPNGQR